MMDTFVVSNYMTYSLVSFIHRGGNLREPYIVSPGQSVVVHQHRWRDYFGAVVLGGGVVWATAHLIKTYVLPYFNISTEDKKSKELEKAVEELNSGFRQVATEIRDSLQTIQKLLEEQQRLLISINADLTTTKARVNLVPSDVTTLSDIKTEITSLKSLLLGRRQFPPTPFGQPASPSIPAWQRVAVVNKSKGTDDVGEEKREPAGEASSSNLHKSGVKDTAADKADDGLDLSLERRSSHGDNTGDFDEKSNAESDQLDRNLDRTPSQTEREVISSLENSFSSTLNNTENQVD